MFKTGNYWLKLTPDGEITKNAPEILKPQTKPNWNYHTAETLAIGGIYSDKDTNRSRDLLIFPIEKGSVLNKIASGMSGRPINNQGISISPFLDAAALEALAESTFNQLWSKFLTFGTASAGILGLFLVFRLIKLILDTIIHGYAIYSLYGFSVHLLGAVFNSVTQLLLHLGHIYDREKETPKDEGEELEEMRVEKNKEKVPTKEELERHEQLEKYTLYPHLYEQRNNRDSI